MSGRSRIPPHHPMKGGPLPPFDEPPFTGGRGPPPPHHPHLLDDLRDLGPPPPFAGGPRGGTGPIPPHAHQAAMIEERFAASHQDIQVLLVDNQGLAATHVALKQEVAAAQQQLQQAFHVARTAEAQGEAQLREMYEKSMKMEADLRAVDQMRTELIQVRGDIQKLSAARQELANQAQMLTQELSKATADVQQAPAIKSEIEYMKQELQQARQAIEYEKKGYAENYEQGQVMEKNLISMAREVEKLRAEVANAEKRARAAAAAGNQGSAPAGYGGNYANPDPSYGGNPYPAAYAMNPQVPSSTDGPQYAAGGGSAPGHGPWGSYDVQRTHARR